MDFAHLPDQFNHYHKIGLSETEDGDLQRVVYQHHSDSARLVIVEKEWKEGEDFDCWRYHLCRYLSQPHQGQTIQSVVTLDHATVRRVIHDWGDNDPEPKQVHKAVNIERQYADTSR